MFSFLKKKNTDIRKVAEKQLSENVLVIKSLRDYDTGKKDISTADIERRMSDIQTASRT